MTHTPADRYSVVARAVKLATAAVAALSLGLAGCTGLNSTTATSSATPHSSHPAHVVFPGTEWATATPESQGIEPARLWEAVEHIRQNVGENSTDEVVIVRNGYVIWAGPEAARRHLVWSCTKSFMSTCLGLLWDDGRVTPGDLASTYVPALRDLYPKLTLEQLATFTGGYAHAEGKLLEPAAPLYAPGAAFHYSDQSDLLAACLTKAGGRTLESLFRERVAGPIGIKPDELAWGTVAEIDGVTVNGGVGAPPGGVQITALAMARFGWLMCNDGVWNGKRLISSRYLSYATQPRTARDLPPFDPSAWYVHLPGNYGLNWWTNGPKPEGELQWPHAPRHTFVAQGNKNNNCFVVPEWRLVVVRLGDDRIVPMEVYDRVFELLDPAKQRLK
jgi:CubicO group peptidase (beta-lactamase class C family)